MNLTWEAGVLPTRPNTLAGALFWRLRIRLRFLGMVISILPRASCPKSWWRWSSGCCVATKLRRSVAHAVRCACCPAGIVSKDAYGHQFFPGSLATASSPDFLSLAQKALQCLVPMSFLLTPPCLVWPSNTGSLVAVPTIILTPQAWVTWVPWT